MIEEFVKAEKVNADKLRENIILMAMNEMIKCVDEKLSIPKALEQNKLLWARSMFRVKKL